MLGDLDGNRERAAEAIAEAAAAGARIVVLPELCTSGYAFAGRGEADALAEPADGPTLAGWHAQAERDDVVVIGGFCERGAGGLLYNAAAVVDRDGVRAVYRKVHLWDAERVVFEPGEVRPPVVDTAAGRLGVAICYDAYFPELMRALALDGAELIAVPSSSPLTGPAVEPLPMEVIVAMAAAHVNRVFVAVADRTGDERGIAWAEASAIVDVSGALLARPRAGRAVLLARCALARARDKRWGERNDLFADRRPRVYAAADERQHHDDRRSGHVTDEKTGKGLLERLDEGPVICAEGYLFEFERRGYLQAGAFVPEVVLEHPDLVRQLHREFVHAGSDVVEAFTYYGHREKLRLIGKEHLLEPLNRDALEIAKGVAAETGTLTAGNLCNTNAFHPDAAARAQVRAMFEEQVGWIVEAGADFIIAETFSYGEEALLALQLIQEAGLPAVVTLAIHRDPETREGWTPEDACRRLAEAGADVVGLNCIRGPRTMLPLIERIREAVDTHVAALPVPYRTTEQEPSFQSLRDRDCDCVPGGLPFPTALDPFLANRYEISEFGRAAHALGVNYLGVCCGAAPHYVRSLAEALGRTPPASRYSPDMSKHAFLGTDVEIKAHNREYAARL